MDMMIGEAERKRKERKVDGTGNEIKQWREQEEIYKSSFSAKLYQELQSLESKFSSLYDSLLSQQSLNLSTTKEKFDKLRIEFKQD